MNIEIEKLHKKLYSIIDEYLNDERKESIKAMYEDLGERLYLAPASSIESYHNAFPGGYLEHILRVADFAIEVYKTYNTLGLDVSDFDLENLVFVALHHDLGKLGFPGEGNELYVPNDSEWHRTKLGQIYKPNEKNPFTLIQDQSLFLLQYYQIPMNWVEFISIKIHDGLYDEVNKPYYIGKNDQSKLRTNLPFIVHQADLMAARFEYERWKGSKNSAISSTTPPPVKKQRKVSSGADLHSENSQDMKKAFESIFGV